MSNLALGRKLSERKDQLKKDLRDTQANEAVNPDAVNSEVNSASIEEALVRIEAHEDYKAHLRAEELRKAILDAVNGEAGTATLEQLEAMAAALK